MSLVDVATKKRQVVYKSQVLKGYDYDTCAKHGGWGSNGKGNDGCYSPPQNVDVETDFRTTGFYVQFDFVNNAPRPGGQGDQH